MRHTRLSRRLLEIIHREGLYRGITALVEETGCERHSVIRSLQKLKSNDLIEIVAADPPCGRGNITLIKAIP